MDTPGGGKKRIIAGDMPDGPMHAKPIGEDGNYETELLTRFHKQLGSTQDHDEDMLGRLADMQKRVSTYPVDKVAGLAFPLRSQTIPAYHESESLEDAWTALVNAMHPLMRGGFLLVYPGVGLGPRKWRPAWEQVMTVEHLPPWNTHYGCSIHRDDETDKDCFDLLCIENGHVRGLDVQSTEGGDRRGELVVESADRIQHTFAVYATHQIPIPEDTYMLLGSGACPVCAHPLREACADNHTLYIDRLYLAVGRRLPDGRFEKVSVVVMDEPFQDKVKSLQDMGIARVSDTYLA